MTAQNIYDDPEFLAGYVTLDRQVRGLDGAVEWPVLRSLLPDLEGCRVVDLGCGFGWFSRWANDHGATSVLGIDISTRMLERARSETGATAIEYRRSDLDVLELEPHRLTPCSAPSRSTTSTISPGCYRRSQGR